MIKLLKNILTHPILRNEGGFWGAVAGAGIGAVASALGQQLANRQNKSLSNKQMDFQRRMSNTAHQRQVADMQAAGLNPMLSAMGGSGASAPTGQTAQMQNEMPDMANTVATALEARKLSQELKNLKAQERQINVSSAKTKTENTLLKANQPIAEIKNSIGNSVKKQVETYKNSARDIHKHIPVPFEKARMKKAESKAMHGIASFKCFIV